MFFSLGDQPQGVAMYPISGFPRCLMEELTTSMPHPLQSSILTLGTLALLSAESKVQRTTSSNTKTFQWNTNRPDLEQKISVWTLTTAEISKVQSPFQLYGSADYVKPGNAEPDSLDSLKRKYHGGPSLESVTTYGSATDKNPHGIAELSDGDGPVT